MELARVYARIRATLPASLQRQLRRPARALVEWQFRRFIRKHTGRLVTSLDPGPMPPDELVSTTSLLEAGEIAEKSDPNFYFSSGRGTIMRYLRGAESQGFDLSTLRSALELGCGTSRLLRHLRQIEGMRLVGTDVNPECIAWCRANVPGIEFHVNQLEPPLAFARDGEFDVAYAQSVFTHIPIEWQPAWIAELCRVLRPGGLLLCTVLGARHMEWMLDDEDRRRLEKDGHLTLDGKHPRASYSTKFLGSWDVFQTRDEVRRAFGTCFDILDYGDGPNLDLLVLRPKARTAAPAREPRPRGVTEPALASRR